MGAAGGVSLLTTLAAGSVIFLLGAIIAIGARARPEDAAVKRRRGDGGSYAGDIGGSGDSCGSDAGGDCGGGDGGGGDGGGGGD